MTSQSVTASQITFSRPERSLWRDAMHRFSRNKLSMAAAILVLVLIFLALFAPWIAPTHYDEQVYTEIREETGLDREDLKLIAKARPIEITDRQLKTTWIVHPYLFHVDSPDNIKIDWEHRESKWISPEDLGKYPTVPELKKTLAALMPEQTPEKR